nr:TetR/AcrR family transcriptional regulator [Hyphomonas sp. Mor2]
MPAPQDSLTRRQKVEERERTILAAAREAFLELGYEGARMADIASRAGIAEGTIYLYYKTKNELMHAFVADFWDDLTRSARLAVSETSDTFEALRQLATFHLSSLIERFDVVVLTQSAHVQSQDLQDNRAFMRVYVSVFDSIWRRGIDRGDVRDDVEFWLVRDLFFGPLEYSARTIRLHPERRLEDAVDQLIDVLKATHGKARNQVAPQHNEVALLERLERAVEKLERQ